MKTPLQISILIFAIVFSFFVIEGCQQSPKKENTEETSDSTTVSKDTTGINMYVQLRANALKVTAQELGLEVKDDEKQVYGIVMDWDLGSGIATLAAYQSGDVSMYLSNGTSVIGGGEHENVRESVVPFLETGQEFLSDTLKVGLPRLPDRNGIIFHLMTNKGIYSTQANAADFENGTSDLLLLFEKANKVMTELRTVSEAK